MKALKNAKNDNKIHNPPPVAKASLRSEPEPVQLYAPAKAKEKEGRKGELNFFDIGITTGTDKVLGEKNLPLCLKDDKACGQPQQVRDECRPFGHFYHTMYQQTIGTYSLDDAAPFQFLEVGFFHGNGYDMTGNFFRVGIVIQLKFHAFHPVHGRKESGHGETFLRIIQDTSNTLMRIVCTVVMVAIPTFSWRCGKMK